MKDTQDLSRVGETLYEFCRGLNTARSLTVWLLWKHGEHKQLAELSFNPHCYLDAWSLHKDYLATKFLAKYEGLETGIDTCEVALQKFKSSEAQCKETNARIREATHRGFSPRLEAAIMLARRQIGLLLDSPTFYNLLEAPRWGPGVTFSLKGDVTLEDKIGEDPISVTASALPYLRTTMECDPHWGEALFGCEVVGKYSLLPRCFETVKGCRVVTVAKDAKTDRTIAIEPTGNVYLQLAVGRYFRKRLQRVGIDLDDQSRNQWLAYRGSITGELATIDLSSASDTVSRELLWLLFPYEVVTLLDCLRSRKALMPDGTWIELEKFSSMGNGFTFELETIIFWALSIASRELSSAKGTVSVYGDDIVIPRDAYAILDEVLRELGFTVNTEKSFATGYFRESCGKHYFRGVDVTPIYQKETLATLDSVYRGANRLLRLAFRLAGGVGWLGLLRPAVKAILKGAKVRHYIPFDSEGDDGLLSPLKVVRLKALETRSGCVRLKTYTFRPAKRRVRNERTVLANWLRTRGRLRDDSACYETSNDRATLAYWLRLSAGAPFEGALPLRRKGRYVERRRWFLLAVQDVAWV